jgi:formate dehydrogenase maturation protein FdhE
MQGLMNIGEEAKPPFAVLPDPSSDDAATLCLDMLMAGDGWKRGGRNPFLLGY